MNNTVAHLVYNFNIGGLEQGIVNLINSSADDKVRHIVITLTPNFELAHKVKGKAHFYCLNKHPGNDVSSHIKLLKLLRKIRPNVLHTYNFGTFEYQMTAFAAKVPVRVHAEHGRDGEYDKKKRQRRSWLRRLFLPFVHHFVVVSPDLNSWAKKSLNLKKPKLQFVLNGIETDKFCCNRPNQPRTPFVFVAVGRLSQVKNHHLLIEAFSILLKKTPKAEIRLRLIGDGPLYNSLQSRIMQLDLSKYVELVGSRNDIPKQLCEADAFVLTSNYEAMPLTVLEAMASGLPLICTNVGGVINIVTHNETGLLVGTIRPQDFANAMEKVMKYDDHIKMMKQRAEAMVEKKFSAAVMTNKYMKLYRLI